MKPASRRSFRSLTPLLTLLCWSCDHRQPQPPVHQPLPHQQIAEAAASMLTRPATGTPPAAAGAPGTSTVPDVRAPGAWPFTDPRPDDAAAARKRPMTIRDLYRVKNLADPQISPDGRQVVFVQTAYDMVKGSRDTHLWLVRLDGKGLRQLTRCKGADYSPRWAPGGKQLLFVSSRGARPQLYRLDLAGGDPEQLTTLTTGVSNPIWSADGKRIVFRSKVFPDLGADDARNQARLKQLRNGPVQAVLANDLLFRHWTSYDDGRRNHVLSLDVATRKITDLTPGPHHAPPLSLHGHRDYALSPDGKELCYQSNHDAPAIRASSTNNDLFVVSTAPGPKPVNLTVTNKAWDGSCAYSPDGRSIAYRLHRRPGYESDRPRLALLDRKTGKTRVLTPKFDYWVDQFHWLPDSRRLLFSAPVRGRWPLFIVDSKTGQITRLPAPPSVRHFNLSPDGSLIVFVHTTVARPPELYVVTVDGTTPRQLTEINKKIATEVDFRPAEELWIPGDGGRKIHTFVVKPHGFTPGQKYPLILNVHGGPQYQWADAFRGDWQVYPAAGYVVAFPNTTGSVGYGQKFTEGISKDWGGRVYRDTMAVAESLAKLPYVDGDRMGVMGWSYGGYLVNWIGGQTNRFRALASMMGVYDLATFFATTEEQWFPEWDLGGQPWTPQVYAKFSPSKFVGRYKTPTLILSGQLDFRIPYTQSIALFTALRKRGVPARLVLFKNDGHWPDYVRSMPVYYNAHLEWFHQHLKGGPAPWKTADMIYNRAYGKK